MESDFQQGRADSAGVAMRIVKKHRREFLKFFVVLYLFAQVSALIWGLGHGVRAPWLLWQLAPLFDGGSVMHGVDGEALRQISPFGGGLISYKFSIPGEWMVYAGYVVFEGLVPTLAAVWLFCCLRLRLTPEAMLLLLRGTAMVIFFTAGVFAAATWWLIDLDSMTLRDSSYALALFVCCLGPLFVAMAAYKVMLGGARVKSDFDKLSEKII